MAEVQLVEVTELFKSQIICSMPWEAKQIASPSTFPSANGSSPPGKILLISALKHFSPWKEFLESKAVGAEVCEPPLKAEQFSEGDTDEVPLKHLFCV